MNDLRMLEIYSDLFGHTIYEAESGEVWTFKSHLFSSLLIRNAFGKIFADENFSFLYRRDGSGGYNNRENMLIYLILGDDDALLHAELYPDIKTDIKISTALADSFNAIANAEYPEYVKYTEGFDGYMSYLYTKSCSYMWWTECPDELKPFNDMLREVFEIIAKQTNTEPHNLS